MIVNSHLCEFGYELISVLPYAYHLHKNGRLRKTISGYDTKPLYFFSKLHEEVDGRRAFNNIHLVERDKVPNTNIHLAELDWTKWEAPPLKEYYAPKAITFSKPTVCICNRYNREWDKDPINFFDLDVLRRLFDTLKDKYQIVYVNLEDHKYRDHNDPMKLGDYEMIYKEYPEVKTMKSLVTTSYNETQLRVFAGCEKFITMNGGLAILASYFGGQNIIYCKESQELRHNTFDRWYWRFGGSDVKRVGSYPELLNEVYARFISYQKAKTYFLINTYNIHNLTNTIKTVSKSDPSAKIVVFTDSKQTDHLIRKMDCIIEPRHCRSKVKNEVTKEDIRKHCPNGEYQVMDIYFGGKAEVFNNKNKHRLQHYDIPVNEYIPEVEPEEQLYYERVKSSIPIIYTAVSESYRYQRDDIVCFTPKRTDNEVMDAKKYKILGHRYFSNDILIWVDGNIFPNISPQEMVDKYLMGYDLAIFKHPHRDCLFDERNAILETQRLRIPKLIEGIDRQYNDYMKERVPLHFGLWECNFIIRRNTTAVNTIFERWWEQIVKYQWRDQVSLPYVMWKYGKNIKLNTVTTGDIRTNPFFTYLDHY